MFQLTKFSHTRILQVYHSVLNKWASKSTHFSYIGMVTQCKLASIDLNQVETLEQAKMKNGDEWYDVFFQRLPKPSLLSL